MKVKYGGGFPTLRKIKKVSLIKKVLNFIKNNQMNFFRKIERRRGKKEIFLRKMDL